MIPEIRLVDWGIANNFGSYIEVNKNLRKYPNLLNPIMAHELKHTTQFFSWEDLKLDLADDKLNNIDMLMFMIAHPKSLTQLLPFYWTPKKGFVYDVNLTIIYLSMLSVSLLTFFIGGKLI